MGITINLIFDKNHSCFTQNLGLFLMVVLHVFNLYKGHLSSLESVLWNYSNLCVCFFSFVSGYGYFCKALHSKLSLEANLMKYWQLYKKYLLILLLSLPIYISCSNWNIVEYLKHTFLLSHSFNPIYWYLKFYLIISIISVCITKLRTKYVLLLSILFLIASVILSLCKKIPAPLFVYTYQMAIFCFGGYFFRIIDKHSSIKLPSLIFIIAILIGFCMVKTNIWQFQFFKLITTVILLSIIPIPNCLSGYSFKNRHNSNIWLIHGNIMLLLVSILKPWNMYCLLFVTFFASYIISIFVNMLLNKNLCQR